MSERRVSRPDPGGHGTFDEFAVGWALHALEPEDEIVFSAHLPGCARCAQTVAETTEVMGALAQDIPRAEPGPGLRDRLRAAVEETPQVPSPAVPPRPEQAAEPPAGESTEPPAAPAAPRSAPAGDPGPAAGAARATGFPAYRPRDAEPSPADPPPPWRRVLPNALVAAAVAAILGLGSWNVVLSDARDDAVARATEQAEVVQSLLEPGTATIAPLSGDDGQVATVVARDAQVQVVTQGLALNDRESQVYVVWGMSGGAPAPLGTFDVTRSRTDVQTVRSTTTGLDDFEGYAISLEPGRAAPSEPTVVVASG
ncbi:anti-sigma factor domain-containing protein [Trujillonella humicola]|uniref:anti-sigma factor domain-containing protein n=1 Tax=Trujillonella humicola TaxID=3383699 RepID=UPI003906CC8B